jgi:hypothetical protein
MLGRFKMWFRMHERETAFAAIIFLVATVSFALGYLANREFNHAPIIIERRVE